MMKRWLDMSASAIGLLFLLPLFCLVAVFLKLDSPGPVFFRQRRVGRGFRPFTMYKFRSMVVDADRMGGLITATGDPRVTRVGRWLRRLKIDELPQLINVFVGDMSLVGPRPEVPRYVDLHRESYDVILRIRPGITDPASLWFRDEESLLAAATDPEAVYVNTILPKKIELAMDYVRNASLTSDVLILAGTMLALVRRSRPGAEGERRARRDGSPRRGG